MQFLKLFVIALVVAAALTVGLVATVVVVLGAIVYFAVRRLLGGSAKRAPLAAARKPDSAKPGSEIIDVSATEVR